MKNMSNCPEHGMYPGHLTGCPECGSAQSAAPRQLTPQEHISRMTDTEVKYIFNSVWWDQGTQEVRQLCLAEYDKRIGLENWPAHISKDE